jgi:rod shape-determining protein MreC
MPFPAIRHRVGYLFLAVAIGQLVLISAQASDRSRLSLLGQVAFAALSEVQRAVAGVADGVGRLWGGYVALRSVHRENADLRGRVADLEVRLQQQRAMVERSTRLQQLLDLRDRLGFSTTAANVIAGSATPDFRAVTIDKGTWHGVKDDMAAIAAAGVVGRVIMPGPRVSKVQLLVDRNAAAAGLIERSRAQGIVMGSGEDLLRMEYLASLADVTRGDSVVTSGIDGIYPKGLLIGRVENVERAGSAYITVRVRPAVDFSRLEEVLIVLARPAGEADEGERQ